VPAKTRHPVVPPVRRPLRVFAFDPMHAQRGLGTVVVEVENEGLQPGPRGERVHVVDYDATQKRYYEPVDLDDPAVLMQQGIAPSEADPRFHQQMVYAVALKVLENFDLALGRRITFRGEPLLLLPHAFHDANAFFDPGSNSVCFGYFTADPENPGHNLPGQTVFTCLSQDIVAHEVTHAVVHRMRRYFGDPTNHDVLAFHEGFSDIVAIFQHFTFPDVLSEAIAATRGELHSPSELIGLAEQFGHATGQNGALRSAVTKADPGHYRTVLEPHARGSILVAAVFDAFFAVYQQRIGDLVRIASEGRGVLPQGDLHPDLVDRLAREASAAAQEILTMCMRAFEYVPPVDITFGDYLRALVTADHDLAADAGADRRRAMIEAFRRRGIFPDGVISLTEDALRLPEVAGAPNIPAGPLVQKVVTGAQAYGTRGRMPIAATETEPDDEESSTNNEVYNRLRSWGQANAKLLQLNPDQPPAVHGFHATYRVNPYGELVVEVVAQFVQMRDTTGDARFGGVPFRGGATVVAAADGRVRLVIAKPMDEARAARQTAFVTQLDRANPALPWADPRDLARRGRRDFRSLHRGLVQ
jgi:hypothetical protein